MRCISPYGRYSIQVFEGQSRVGVDMAGVMHSVELTKPVVADFEQGGLTEWEIEAALMSFNFAGVPDGVNPLTRVAVFDTEAYVQQFPESERDEKLAAIDARLRELQQRHPSDFVIVEKPAAPKPWPSYDSDTPSEIVALQKRTGISPEAIRLYEYENGGRQVIIDLMTEIEEGREPADLEVVSVEEAITVNA